MNLLLVLALLQAPAAEKSVDDHIAAFLKGDDAARAELIKLGVYALRPLVARAKTSEKIDALILDLKEFTAYPAPIPLTEPMRGGVVASLGPVTQHHLGRMMDSFHDHGLPAYIDRFDPSRVPGSSERNRNRIFRGNTPLQLLTGLCDHTGLEYAFYHNFVVVGVPERLWPLRPRKPHPAIDAAGLAKARQLIERLGDESIEVRENAARELLALGPALTTLLEEQRTRSEKEIVARCESILARLREPLEGAFGPSACARQKLSGRDDDLLRHLQGTRPRLVYLEESLGKIATRLKDHGVDCTLPVRLHESKVTITVRGQSLFDFLSVMTQSLDLDFAIFDRAVVIDSPHAIDARVRGEK